MALPLSRNTTYGPGSPVRSVDLNALQDCIVGGKRGQGELILGADAFQPAPMVTWFADPGQWQGAANYVCAIHNCVGFRLKTITTYYNRNGAGTVQSFVRRHNVTTAVKVDVWASAVDSTSGAVVASQTSSPTHIFLSQHAYRIEVVTTNASNGLYGAILIFDIP